MHKGTFLFILFFARAFLGQTIAQSTCTGNLGSNIFLRGDFGSGIANILPVDPKLAPGYIYQFNPPPNDGFYTITNNTRSWGSFAQTSWIRTGDNSLNPNGYFMVVNASIQPGLFYLDTVDVCGNTNYFFSADVISMNLPATASGVIKPNISFLVDGKDVYASGNVPVDGQWHTYGFSFRTAPGASRIVLALRNNAPGGNGNDLGLDNISFRPCGPKIEVLDTVLYRRDSIAVISAKVEASVFSDPRFQWQRSTDYGLSWMDIPGATDLTIVIPKPVHGHRYRMLVGDGLSQLALPSCRVNSDEVLVREDAVRDTLRVAVCPGETYEAYGQQLAAPGAYEFFFPSNYQGDRVVTIEVRVEDLSAYAIQGPSRICKGDTVTLYAGQFGAIAWSTGQLEEAIRVTRPGTYSVEVTSIYGCSAADSITLEGVEVVASLESISPSCRDGKDGQIEFTGFSGGMQPYLFGRVGGAWSINPVVGGLGHGANAVQIQEAGGCKAIYTVLLDNPPVFELDTLGASRIIRLGERTTLTANANQPILSYAWTPSAGVSCPECPAPIVSPDSSTTYSVVVTNARGCTARKSVRVEVIPIRNVYVPTVFSPNEDGINDAFTLYLGRGVLKVHSFQIFDRQGGVVFAAFDLPPNAPELFWNGAVGGQAAPARTYIWTAVLAFTDGTTERLSGEVSLLR